MRIYGKRLQSSTHFVKVEVPSALRDELYQAELHELKYSSTNPIFSWDVRKTISHAMKPRPLEILPSSEGIFLLGGHCCESRSGLRLYFCLPPLTLSSRTPSLSIPIRRHF